MRKPWDGAGFIKKSVHIRMKFMDKIGLVLEGGAMRGMFTAGVTDVLMENNIVFDGAVGVSAGATFGCNIKSRQIGRAIRYNKKYCRDKRYCSIKSLIKTGDLYGADFCYNVLPHQLDIFDLKTYRENPMPFYIVASDCRTGKPVYRELKNCGAEDLTWMRASASMPLASKIVKIDGYELLDGGITDSIPLKFFENLGFEKNLVVLTQPREYKKKNSNLITLIKFVLKKYPHIVEAMKNRAKIYNQEKEYVFERESQGKTFVICPETDLKISRIEKNPDELQRVYDIGRTVMEKNLEQLKNFLFM